jgi:CRISPR/Cas system-associated endoribonuclease Cas2
MVQVQYSVFFAVLVEQEAKKIMQQLAQVIDKGCDDVRLYSVRGVEREHQVGKGLTERGLFVFFPSGFSL